MAIETKEKEIGGLRFSVEQLPYFRAQRLFVRLLKIAGPALTGIMAMAGKTSARAIARELADRDLTELTPHLASFFAALQPDDAEQITREILSTGKVYDSARGAWLPLVGAMDSIVGGDFWAGISVQAFALSVHFGNFSSARAALDGLGLRAPSGSPESSTSTDSRAAS